MSHHIGLLFDTARCETMAQNADKLSAEGRHRRPGSSLPGTIRVYTFSLNNFDKTLRGGDCVVLLSAHM